MFPETRVDPGLDLDRRYTTRETMDLCMRLAGVDAWDLDVAADEESHWAPRWYCGTAGEVTAAACEQGLAGFDGLNMPWDGPRVWCNPPYSDIEPWVRKAWNEVLLGECSVVAMLLPATRTEQPWWQEHVEQLRDGAADRNWNRMHTHGDVRFSSLSPRLTTHFLPGRVKFGHPGNRDAVGVGSPPFGCVLLVWRRP